MFSKMLYIMARGMDQLSYTHLYKGLCKRQNINQKQAGLIAKRNKLF
jgi:hypothetical protein